MSHKKETRLIRVHTCDEFERGIREIFLPFQGDFVFLLKSGNFQKNFYQFYGSFPGVFLMMREVSHV